MGHDFKSVSINQMGGGYGLFAAFTYNDNDFGSVRWNGDGSRTSFQVKIDNAHSGGYSDVSHGPEDVYWFVVREGVMEAHGSPGGISTTPLHDGGWSHCHGNSPCASCHGDCDSDVDCAGTLVCHHDSGGDATRAWVLQHCDESATNFQMGYGQYVD